jgi:hypothetical protein
LKQGFSLIRRPALLAIALLGPTLSLSLLAAAEQSAPARTARPQTAAQRFKNIKVLKKLPADQLLPAMQGINASLGVRCDFCHVVRPDRTGFELDDKPMKGVARQMIVLVNDLNGHQKVIDRKATCYMCHHGHAEPETQAPSMPPPGGGAPPPPPR